MPRVLIAGCGYVGCATADLFYANGWQVEGWTASEDSARARATKPYRVRAVDFSRDVDADDFFDVIIHCASTGGGGPAAYRRVYVDGARQLTGAFAESLLIFTSSTSVYAQRDGEWVTEQTPAEPLHESGRILRDAEQLVLNANGVVCRVAGIYGPGRSALLRKFLDGTATWEERFINQAHRDDIASAFLLLAGAHRPGEIFNIADGNPLLQRDAYAWLAEKLQREIPPVAQHPGERKRGRSNKRVSSDKLQALGWSPQYPDFASAMSQSILPNLATCGA